MDADTNDPELEQAIDSVGRQRVFNLARANGWRPGTAPPKWVWWELVRRVEAARQNGETNDKVLRRLASLKKRGVW